MKRHMRHVILEIAMTILTATIVSAQESGTLRVIPNPSYDGRYAFARLRYAEHPEDPCTGEVGNSRGLFGWMHDYPEGDRNLMHIAADLTSLNARTDSTVVLKADDPQLMRYPILYLSEPGCWHMTESEVKGLRTYLLKGGFLIVDDFALYTGMSPRLWEISRQVFEEQIHRVLPESKIVLLNWEDPHINNFFKLDPEAMQEELTRVGGVVPEVHGIYDRNDPKRRLMVVANYGTAVHRSWVWEAQGESSVEHGNDAYKLGVNYLLYGFMH